VVHPFWGSERGGTHWNNSTAVRVSQRGSMAAGHRRGGERGLIVWGQLWCSHGPRGGVSWAGGWPERPDDGEITKEAVVEGNRQWRP
jgi:hypothetical protein